LLYSIVKVRKAKEKVWRFFHQTTVRLVPPGLFRYVFAFFICRISLSQGNFFVNKFPRLNTVFTMVLLKYFSTLPSFAKGGGPRGRITINKIPLSFYQPCQERGHRG